MGTEKEIRPIIRIWDLGDEKYQIDIDTLNITKEEAYNLMLKLYKIHNQKQGEEDKEVENGKSINKNVR